MIDMNPPDMNPPDGNRSFLKGNDVLLKTSRGTTASTHDASVDIVAKPGIAA